jgi:hypothetical protein
MKEEHSMNNHDEDNKILAFGAWIDSRGESKASIAREYGISPRTLNREIEKEAICDIKLGIDLQAIANDYKIDISRVYRLAAEVEAEDSTNAIESAACDDVDDALEADEEEVEEINFVITNSAISLYQGQDVVTVASSDNRFDTIKKLLVNGDLTEAMDIANILRSIEKFSEGSITVEGAAVLYKGYEVVNSMADRLVNMLEHGSEGVKKFARFFESLMAVPDKRVVEELYPFLQHMDIEINDDGSFYAYKAVRSNYTDLHSGRMDNSIGSVPEMPRHMVDDDKYRPCSAGLHFAALDYAVMFSGWNRDNRIMKVKVFPADVVSVPVDYSGQKGRACKYEVVEDVTDKV